MKHEIWGAPEKFGGWGISVRLAAWLLATQYRECLLKTLYRRKQELEKANEVMKKISLERSCICRDAPCLQLLFPALILLSSALPTWVLLGVISERSVGPGHALCLGTLRDLSLWPHRKAVSGKQCDQTSSSSYHLQPLSFSWQQMQKMKSTIFIL